MNCAKCRVLLDFNMCYEKKNGLIYCRECTGEVRT